MSYETISLTGPGVRTLEGKYNIQTAMPLGGIGAGCICLNGQGGLQDFSIRNRAATTMLPDHNGFLNDVGFGSIHWRNGTQDRRNLIVEAPLPAEKIYAFGTQVMGHRKGGIIGLPHYQESKFVGSFPFGQVILSDKTFPLQATITGWNPFIPSDVENSGIPAAILEYRFENTSTETVEYDFAYSLSHLAQIQGAPKDTSTRNEKIDEGGIHLFNNYAATSELHGSAAVISLDQTPDAIKAMWYRGFWFDSLTMLWNELESGQFTPNDGVHAEHCKGWNGGTLLFKGELKPGDSVTYPLAITWHFPNGHFHSGYPKEKNDLPTPPWRTWYSTRWKNAAEVARYLKSHGPSLREQTLAFRDTLMSSTLPGEVLDALSANLAILKSPTVLRQANGDFWAWEGSGVTYGSCPGSCTHVWNYAQALAHLFPELERSLRTQEYHNAMDESGHVVFRFPLPSGPSQIHDYYAAADGQLGGLLKLHRDWVICGDTAWLASLYPLAKRSLEYCIATWDPEEKGNLFHPHHNTYDIEFKGPNGMCGSIYIAALSAMSALAKTLGEETDAERYQHIAQRGARHLSTELFNGEYYFQKVDDSDAHPNNEKAGFFQDSSPNDPEYRKLIQEEGPKYQYGEGCLSDGIIGAWFALACGVTTPMDTQEIRQTLQSIYRYNFRGSLENHTNAQRPGYALNQEGGLLLCSWPKGPRPSLPFVYADEVWTGIEYQVASHLISEGFISEGLDIVRTTRSRYDGYTRNPWNEYECGSYYARALASYALLQACSGIAYDAVHRHLTISPRIQPEPYQCFFTFGEGYGKVEIKEGAITVHSLRGHFELDKLTYAPPKNERSRVFEVGTTITESGKAEFLL